MAQYHVLTEFTFARTYTIEVNDEVVERSDVHEFVRTAAARQALAEITDRKNGHTIKSTIEGEWGSAGFVQFAGHINAHENYTPKPDHGGDNKIATTREKAAALMQEGQRRATEGNEPPPANAFCTGHLEETPSGVPVCEAGPGGPSEPAQPARPDVSAGRDAGASDT